MEKKTPALHTLIFQLAEKMVCSVVQDPKMRILTSALSGEWRPGYSLRYFLGGLLQIGFKRTLACRLTAQILQVQTYIF